MKSQIKALNVLVIDDDPVFRMLIAKAAKAAKVSVTVAGSLEEVNPLTVPRIYDVVVIDYYLDDIQLNLKGADIADVLAGTPVLLTSVSEHAVEDGGPWPESVRKFVAKKQGAASILKQAAELVGK
ncbi:hypothetical protein K2X33_04480 [bacterium]|nr:hypothetical protein [bacterium]